MDSCAVPDDGATVSSAAPLRLCRISTSSAKLDLRQRLARRVGRGVAVGLQYLRLTVLHHHCPPPPSCGATWVVCLCSTVCTPRTSRCHANLAHSKVILLGPYGLQHPPDSCPRGGRLRRGTDVDDSSQSSWNWNQEDGIRMPDALLFGPPPPSPIRWI
jgi:hypothetical protein